MRKFITGLLLCFLVGTSFAQSATDHWGAWYMYFGTNRVSDRLSVHTEAQMRLYEPTSNFNQFLPRVGLNYHHNSKTTAISTLGYALIPTASFAKDSTETRSLENRIFQQFISRAPLGPRTGLEHRYRLEQRWISVDGAPNVLLHRARYRIFASHKFFDPAVKESGLFVAFYDEIFIDIDTDPFDQNRLYGALGYQINKKVNIQAGYLYHRAGPDDLSRLQLGLVFNTDFRNQD